MKEIWKDIKGYEGLYKISNLGNVLRCKKIKIDSKGRKRIFEDLILKANINKNGYKYVNLHNKKKQAYKIHRLVAQTFIPNQENKPQVNHIDGNKENNRVDNLEWVTGKENIRHAYKNNLIKSLKIPKEILYNLYFKKKYTLKEIGRIYGYSEDAVRRLFHSYGFQVARNNARIEITKKWIIEQLKSDKTQKMIAKEYNISSGYLSELCKKYNLYKDGKPNYDEFFKQESNNLQEEMSDKNGINSRRKIKDNERLF